MWKGWEDREARGYGREAAGREGREYVRESGEGVGRRCLGKEGIERED